ncbi:MAG: glycosyltransferase family 4 protein [Chloroflexi bacterium]|nr:glycosyltransferase family 4 protein [Chloroflexota bacterium]
MKAIVAIFEQLVPISGGGTPRTWHIVQSLQHRGHEVYVAAAYGVAAEEARQQLGCAGVLPLPHVSRLDRRKMLKYLFVYPWNILRLALYIARVRPELVISHNTVAGFGALLGRRLSPSTVTVLDLTDLLFEYLESYKKRWIQWVLGLGRALERHTIRHSDRIVTISEAMRQILVQDYGIAASRIDIVHDGVDCRVFYSRDSSALRQRLAPRARHVCILHGVIDPQDGPGVLAEAAPHVLARFPDTAFWWVGDGAAVPGLRAHAEQMQLTESFFFSGWVRQEQVVDYINASDLGIVVLPDTLSARGRVTLKEFEYWACGKAAVLPRLPALQEIIPEGQASLFFTPGDAQDLGDKICTLLEDDRRREAMGEAGRQMVASQFEWTILTEQLAQLCEGYASGQADSHGAPEVSGGC